MLENLNYMSILYAEPTKIDKTLDIQYTLVSFNPIPFTHKIFKRPIPEIPSHIALLFDEI